MIYSKLCAASPHTLPRHIAATSTLPSRRTCFDTHHKHMCTHLTHAYAQATT